MDTAISTKPRTVFFAQALFWLNAAIWLVFGLIGLMRLSNSGNPSITLWVVAILMFGNVGAMLIAGFWLGRQSRWAFFFALAVLAVNILLTFTDQVGFFDIITAILDLGLFGLLLFDRKNYRSKQ
jgi:hypothetical protein